MKTTSMVSLSLLWLVVSVSNASSSLKFALHVEDASTIGVLDLQPTNLSYREISLAPNATSPVYISLVNEGSESVCLDGASFHLAGWAVDDPSLYVTSSSLIPEAAISVRSGQNYEIGFGQSLTIEPNTILPLVELQVFFVPAFEAGALRLYGLEQHNLTPTALDCSGKFQITGVTALLLKNNQLYPEGTPFVLFPDAPYPWYSSLNLPSRRDEVLAGTATVGYVETPIPEADGLFDLTRLDLENVNYWVGSGPATLTAYSTGVAYPNGDGIVAGLPGYMGPYAILGDVIAFVLTRYRESYSRVRGYDTRRLWMFSFSRCLLQDPSIGTQEIYNQKHVYYQYLASDPDGLLRAKPDRLSQDLIASGMTLDELKNHVLNYYGGGQQ